MPTVSLGTTASKSANTGKNEDAETAGKRLKEEEEQAEDAEERRERGGEKQGGRGEEEGGGVVVVVVVGLLCWSEADRVFCPEGRRDGKVCLFASFRPLGKKSLKQRQWGG